VGIKNFTQVVKWGSLIVPQHRERCGTFALWIEHCKTKIGAGQYLVNFWGLPEGVFGSSKIKYQRSKWHCKM